MKPVWRSCFFDACRQLRRAAAPVPDHWNVELQIRLDEFPLGLFLPLLQQ